MDIHLSYASCLRSLVLDEVVAAAEESTCTGFARVNRMKADRVVRRKKKKEAFAFV